MEPLSGGVSLSKDAFLSTSIVAQFLAGSIPLEGIPMHMCPSDYPRSQLVALLPIKFFRKPLQTIKTPSSLSCTHPLINHSLLPFAETILECTFYRRKVVGLSGLATIKYSYLGRPLDHGSLKKCQNITNNS